MPTETVVDQKPAQQPPVDPNVKIPTAAVKAAAVANAYYTKPTADVPAAGGADAPINIAEEGAQPTGAAPSVPSPSTTHTTNGAGAPDWERNYKGMEGRFKKAEQVNAELNTRLNDMANALLRQQEEMRKVAPPPPAPPRQKLITEQEEKDYGPELLDVVKRAAREDIVPVVASMQQQIASLHQQLGAEKTQGLYNSLTTQIPNWRVINQSPQFISWLRLQDPYSGAIRHGLLTDAFKSGDASRVLRFFEGFIKDEAASGSASPAPAPNAPQPSAAAQRQAAVSLDLLAAPGRARATPDIPSSAGSQKPTFTHADISKFYDGVRRGHWRGRDADKDALERQIFAAQTEGRVKG